MCQNVFCVVENLGEILERLVDWGETFNKIWFRNRLRTLFLWFYSLYFFLLRERFIFIFILFIYFL